jgi:hypothetical protein
VVYDPGNPKQPDGYTISERDVRRLGELLRRIETLPRFALGDVSPRDDGFRPAPENWVKVTSVTADAVSGYYPGLWYLFDPTNASFTPQAEAIWVDFANSSTPSLLKVYRAFCEGGIDNRAVFVVDDASTAAVSVTGQGTSDACDTSYTDTPGVTTCDIVHSGGGPNVLNVPIKLFSSYSLCGLNGYYNGPWTHIILLPAGTDIRDEYDAGAQPGGQDTVYVPSGAGASRTPFLVSFVTNYSPTPAAAGMIKAFVNRGLVPWTATKVYV